MQNFGRTCQILRATPIFPALRGPLAGARCPLMAGTWLVETVLSYRPSNILLGPGRRSGQHDEQEIRENSTFTLVALDPEDRLRYPPVSLFFMMCLWSQTARGVQENLFDTRFLCDKVGCAAQNLHGRPGLKMQNFGRTCQILMATPIFPALPGAARWRSLPGIFQSDVSFSLFELKCAAGILRYTLGGLLWFDSWLGGRCASFHVLYLKMRAGNP